jgi:hypothetical protein
VLVGTLTVSVELPPALILRGEKLVVMPLAGAMVALRPMAEVKLPIACALTAKVVLLPACMVLDVGSTAREKSD